jgi:hypothetical protein
MERSRSWEATNQSATQEFPTFYRTRRLNTLYRKARHWFLFQARWIQSIPPHPIWPICFNIILPPMSRSSQCSLSFWLSHRNPICIPLSHVLIILWFELGNFDTAQKDISHMCSLQSVHGRTGLEDRLQSSCYLSRVDHDRKIRSRQQKTDNGK